MERKYRGNKKAIKILSVVVVLLIACIVYLQIALPNAKAKATDKVEAEMTELRADIEGVKAEYEAKGLDEKQDALKAEEKELKAYRKDLEKAWKSGDQAAIDAVVAEYEAPAEEAPVEEAPVEETTTEETTTEETTEETEG